jgi:glycosyltransferase involved in cell wall biosynthesis
VRFCLITTFYPPCNFGGDGLLVQQLASALARRGHAVEVVHCRDAYRATARREPTQGYDDPPGVTVHGLESRAGVLSPLATHQTGRPWFKGRKIREILDRGFDVIHFHNVSLVGGAGLLEYGAGVLKLYTTHEYWLVCPTNLLFRYGRAPCERRTCTLCSLVQRRPPQWWRWSGLVERSLRSVDVLLAPSQFGQELHQRRLGRPVVYLPNFVPEAQDAGGPAPEGAPYVLYVGRLERAKGPHTLVSLFRRFRNAGLLLAGAGREAERLRELARGADHIRFLGALPRERLGALYRGALALVVPSLSFELCPLVVLEAFREGTPVIVRDIGALPELVAGGRGLLYRDDAELTSHLERLLADRSLGAELGRRGREGYAATWSPDAHLARYFEVIEAAADRRGRPVAPLS